MNKIHIHLKTEHTLSPKPKRSPLTMRTAKDLFQVLCSSSMVMETAERFMDGIFDKSEGVDQDIKETTTLSCNSIRNLNDKVIAMKDATQNFIQSRPEMKEVQQGFVRAQYKALSTYLEAFDCQTLSDNLQYIHEECNEVLYSVSTNGLGPLSDIRMVSMAVSNIKRFNDDFSHTSL